MSCNVRSVCVCRILCCVCKSSCGSVMTRVLSPWFPVLFCIWPSSVVSCFLLCHFPSCFLAVLTCSVVLPSTVFPFLCLTCPSPASLHLQLIPPLVCVYSLCAPSVVSSNVPMFHVVHLSLFGFCTLYFYITWFWPPIKSSSLVPSPACLPCFCACVLAFPQNCDAYIALHTFKSSIRALY